MGLDWVQRVLDGHNRPAAVVEGRCDLRGQIEIEGDHDCPLVLPGPFARQTVAAVRDVAQRRERPGFTDSSTRVAGWGV